MPDEEVYELDLPVRTDHFEFGEGEPEMKKNHLMFVLTLLLVFILAACSTPVDELQETVESAATDVAPEVNEALTEAAPQIDAAATEAVAMATEAADEVNAAATAAADEVNAAATAAAEVAPTVEAAATEVAEPEMRTDNLEGETITFYHFGDLSGPLAGITAPLINGFNDAVAAINANGGIRGAEIILEFQDTQSNIDNAVAAYDRFTSEDDNVLVMFTYGSGDGEALASRFAEDQIPNLAAGLSAVAFYGPDSGYTFGYAPIYPDQFGYFLDYITANWETVKPAGAGDDIKLAYISWPTAYGQGAYTPEAIAYAESLGVEIVLSEVLEPSPQADATTAILNAQAAGANVIYTNSLAFGPAAILNGMGSLGLRESFLFGANNWACDLATYAFVSDPALVEGMMCAFPYLYWNDADNPGVQYVESVFQTNSRTQAERGVGYLLTAAGVDLAVAAIEKAIDTVGFDALTGQAVYEALLSLGEYEVLDGIMRVDFSGDNRSPHVAQIRQIQGGQFVMLQDWTATPDLRPAGE